MKKINDQLAIEKMSEHFCIVEEKGEQRNVQICFYSLEDALAYSAERNYL